MRFLVLFLVVGFLLWKIMQMVFRIISRQTHEREVHDGSKSDEKPYAFKDIRDAEFEELKPDDSDKGEQKTR